jgi:hypothetical protein
MRTTVRHPFTAVGTERAVVSKTHHAGSSGSRLPGLARAAIGADRAADRRAVHHRPPTPTRAISAGRGNRSMTPQPDCPP